MPLKKITSLPPLTDRAWLSTPHPSLPLLATCSSNKTVQITSLRTFKPESTIEGGHKRSIRSVAWKPTMSGPAGGQRESVIATGSFDATAGIWRRFEGEGGVGHGHSHAHDEGAHEHGHSHSHSHDGCNGDHDGEGEGGEEEEEEEWRFAVVLDGHESEVKSVAWSAGGTFLATCSRDKSVWVWEEMDDDNFETIAVLQEHTQDVKCVKWHPEEELLASASYDDTIRLYKEDVDDWTCCAVLTGHTSTVWSIDFEPPSKSTASGSTTTTTTASTSPRLVSCSDDLTTRIWTRISPTTSSSTASTANKPPSSLRTNSVEETWIESALLPQVHTRTIYAVAWSQTSGRVVTCGGDGKVVVYKEFEVQEDGKVENGEENGQKEEKAEKRTEWRIVSQLEAAHGVYEVNGVTWARRWDAGKRREGEEMVVTTGDDGVVSFWEVDDDA